jgi:DNA-binding LacI/PurR family transcriptional regulator
VLTPTRDSTPDRPADVYVNAEAARLGLEVAVVASSQALRAATDTALTVLSDPDRPTAVFCFSDSIAYGVYAATRELGLAVPGDVSVAGYDDHPMSALLTPPLTSVDWNIDGIVAAAVKVMLGSIDDRPGRKRVVCDPRLRVRASTGPPARRPNDQMG